MKLSQNIYIYNRPQDDIEGQHRLPSFFGDNLELYNSIAKPQDQNLFCGLLYSPGILYIARCERVGRLSFLFIFCDNTEFVNSCIIAKYMDYCMR